MRTASVEILEAQPAKTGADGRMIPQPAIRLWQFTIQDERVDGLRAKAKAKAHAYLKGRKFSVNMGEFDPRTGKHVMYITCRPGV